MATKVYRDYGALNGVSAPNNEFDIKRYTQVYQATHEGEKRLPFMNRSFISFSYGEKLDTNGKVRPVYIEDFNLLATIEGNRINREAYASFKDLTSEYDVLQGQFYWGTHFHSNSLTFNLATDEMTQRELDDFKHWFRAGQIKELILSEHPNRAIMARVANPPQLKLLPFEKKITIPIGSGGAQDSEEQVTIRNYDTSTTVYRGEIILEFVMDEPFWYAKQNLLGLQDVAKGYYSESWIDANGVEVTVRENKDALKIIYEDRIPLGSTTQVSVFLGGDTYAVVEYKDYQRIVDEITKEEYEAVVNNSELNLLTKYSYMKEGSDGSLTYAAEDNLEESEEESDITYFYYVGASIAKLDPNLIEPDPQNNNSYIGGAIGGADLTSTSEKVHGVSLDPVQFDGKANLYYSGTAPSPVKISFTLTPGFADNYKIISPNNKYGTPEKPYSTITFTATRKHEFQFSLPTIYYSYNQVLQIIDDEDVVAPGNAWLIVRETIRDTIKDPYVRAWANKIIDAFDKSSGSIIPSNIESLKGTIKRAMECIFLSDDGINQAGAGAVTGASVVGLPASFVFDGKTGLALGKFTIRNPFDTSVQFESSDQNELITEIKNKTSMIDIEQNVGDMVKSNYLILDERNVLDEKFQIQPWEEQHPDYAYLITHDLSETLENVHFEFKNLYL